jgi:hypothetical protein
MAAVATQLDSDAQALLDQIVYAHEESGAAPVYGRLDEGDAETVRLLVRQGLVQGNPLGTLTDQSQVVPTPLGRTQATSQPPPSKRAKRS